MARRGTLVMGTAGGQKENVAFDFSDDEWVLLERFAARVDELMDSPAVRAVFDGGVSLAWDHQTGWKPVDKSRLPSKDDLNAFLGYLRPIILVTVGIVVLLIIALRSARDALLVVVNLSLALIGGVVGVFLSGGVLSVASLIGFITLFGIATRNGLMLVSHIRHLVEEEAQLISSAPSGEARSSD